ncbi:MAG: FkbM family methyltransferase [Selenomonadaceae bacterium]|nr:FkbM family methyltransferase [Selenomonadaceae bacterium]
MKRDNKLINIKPIRVQVDGPEFVENDPTGLRLYKINYIKTKMVFRYIDETLIKPIFQDREYAIPIKDFKPKFILDCGGNIGASAVYFANAYPKAKITVVEPNIDNFMIMDVNTAPYENITCIQSAVWDKETHIALKGDHPAAFQVFETDADDPNALMTTTIGKLLADSGFDSIDLLKMDIEGSEKEVFEAPDVHDWLSKVKVLTLELHDRYKRGCSKALFRAVTEYDFLFTQRGENLFFIREELLD